MGGGGRKKKKKGGGGAAGGVWLLFFGFINLKMGRGGGTGLGGCMECAGIVRLSCEKSGSWEFSPNLPLP